MQKILIAIPTDKYPEKLIMRGFSRGFNADGLFVIKNDETKIDSDFLSETSPDIILGYGNYISNNNDILNYKKNNKKLFLISYFADSNLPNKFSQDILYFVNDPDKENENLIYLPLGISSRTYYNEFENYKYTISFIGNPNNKKRLEILAKLISNYGNKLTIFCKEEDFINSLDNVQEYFTYSQFQQYKNAYKGFLSDEKAISKVCSSSLINLNIITSSETVCNFRVFETLASGGFLLTNNSKSVAKLFTLAKDFEGYDNFEELTDKIEFYLKNQDIAQKIAQNGRAKIKGNHTFAKRAKCILELINNQNVVK